MLQTFIKILHHQPGRRNILAGVLVALFCTLPGLVFAEQDASISAEHKVKAAFVYNFMRFTHWPDLSVGPRLRMEICLIGSDDFGKALDAIDGKEVRGHKLVVSHRRANVSGEDCEVIVISTGASQQTRRIIDRLHEGPVLTVSDASGFIDNGGMIEFHLVENKVRFKINKGAAERAGLSISSKLFRLATSVTD